MRTNTHKRGTHTHHRKPSGPVVVPDADIIAMRRMHQVDRKAMHLVQRAFPQYSAGYVRNVLQYVVRAQQHLCVKA
jgi:hypothetical protein